MGDARARQAMTPGMQQNAQQMAMMEQHYQQIAQ